MVVAISVVMNEVFLSFFRVCFGFFFLSKNLLRFTKQINSLRVSFLYSCAFNKSSWKWSWGVATQLRNSQRQCCFEFILIQFDKLYAKWHQIWMWVFSASANNELILVFYTENKMHVAMRSEFCSTDVPVNFIANKFSPFTMQMNNFDRDNDDGDGTSCR